MTPFLSDDEIQRLVRERKPLPADYREQIKLKPGKIGHYGSRLDLTGAEGSLFRIIFRRNAHNPLDFSIIVGYWPIERNRLFHLRRYNGKSHEHTNPLEKKTFYDFHIHEATERYQQQGFREVEKYAQSTSRYGDYAQAVACMIDDCGLVMPPETPPPLFKQDFLRW